MNYGNGRGYGRMGIQGLDGAGPGGECICPKCGYTSPHTVGTPCTSKACPKCGTMMIRKFE